MVREPAISLIFFGGKLAGTGTSAPASGHGSSSGAEEEVRKCFSAAFNFSSLMFCRIQTCQEIFLVK